MWDRLAGSFLAATFWLPVPGLADELIFKNGDRLTGTVVRLEHGKLTFKSDVVGNVTTAVDQLESFSTQEPIELHLTDGRTVSDRVVRAEAGSVRLAGDRSKVGFTEIEEINPEPVQWHGSLAAGLVIERGDTDSQEAHIDFKARREADAYRLRFRLRYKGDRSRSGGSDFNTTDRLLRVTSQYDVPVNGRYFWYWRGQGERDGVADLVLRTILSSGIGFKLIDRSDFSFEVQGGLAWVREDYKDSSLDTDYPSSVIRWDLTKDLHDAVSFFHEGEWTPSLREFSDKQLLITETGLRVQLLKGWFGEAKLHWELDTEPASGRERQNLDYIFALGWGF